MGLRKGRTTAAIVACVGAGTVLPWVVNDYIVQVAIFAVMYSLLGLAFAFTLKVGLPRFDAAAWWGVGAYTSAIMMIHLHCSFWVTLPAAAVVAVALGWLVFRLAIPRGMMVFLMFGLVLALGVQQLFGTWSFFGGWGGTENVSPPTIAGFQLTGKAALLYLGMALLIVNVVVNRLLYTSKIGRAWTAIGASPQLGSSLGIDVAKYRLANVLISNCFLALAGSYYIGFARSAIPSAFGLAASFGVMMYVVVGGLGYSLAGPIVGAFTLTFLAELFRVADKFEIVATSAVTIVIIIFAPMGILGLGERIVHAGRKGSRQRLVDGTDGPAALGSGGKT